MQSNITTKCIIEVARWNDVTVIGNKNPIKLLTEVTPVIAQNDRDSLRPRVEVPTPSADQIWQDIANYQWLTSPTEAKCRELAAKYKNFIIAEARRIWEAHGKVAKLRNCVIIVLCGRASFDACMDDVTFLHYVNTDGFVDTHWG
jgi:hypothetical protein